MLKDSNSKARTFSSPRNNKPFQGAKLFYLSGLIHDQYPKAEVHNLARFISVMKFYPLEWRGTHPYVLADRMEDMTEPESVRTDSKCDRNVCLYGYVRGTNMKPDSAVHIPGGCGCGWGLGAGISVKYHYC